VFWSLRGLPKVWTPDPETERLRRLVTRRSQLFRHRTRIKIEVHAIHAHLIPRCPHADLFNRRGRDWLSDAAPLRLGGLGVVLVKALAMKAETGPASASACVSEGVAHELHAGAVDKPVRVFAAAGTL
jgi:transposase